MSPEDLRDLGATVSDEEFRATVAEDKPPKLEVRTTRQVSQVRRQSPEPTTATRTKMGGKSSSRAPSRSGSLRPASPHTRFGGRDARGRSAGRSGSAIRLSTLRGGCRRGLGSILSLRGGGLLESPVCRGSGGVEWWTCRKGRRPWRLDGFVNVTTSW